MKTSITPSKVRERYSDHRLALCKGVQDILDSGIHAMDFKFQVGIPDLCPGPTQEERPVRKLFISRGERSES